MCSLQTHLHFGAEHMYYTLQTLSVDSPDGSQRHAEKLVDALMDWLIEGMVEHTLARTGRMGVRLVPGSMNCSVTKSSTMAS